MTVPRTCVVVLMTLSRAPDDLKTALCPATASGAGGNAARTRCGSGCYERCGAGGGGCAIRGHAVSRWTAARAGALMMFDALQIIRTTCVIF